MTDDSDPGAKCEASWSGAHPPSHSHSHSQPTDHDMMLATKAVDEVAEKFEQLLKLVPVPLTSDHLRTLRAKVNQTVDHVLDDTALDPIVNATIHDAPITCCEFSRPVFVSCFLSLYRLIPSLSSVCQVACTLHCLSFVNVYFVAGLVKDVWGRVSWLAGLLLLQRYIDASLRSIVMWSNTHHTESKVVKKRDATKGDTSALTRTYVQFLVFHSGAIFQVDRNASHRHVLPDDAGGGGRQRRKSKRCHGHSRPGHRLSGGVDASHTKHIDVLLDGLCM